MDRREIPPCEFANTMKQIVGLNVAVLFASSVVASALATFFVLTNR